MLLVLHHGLASFYDRLLHIYYTWIMFVSRTGATVFRGLEGYGETGEMHRAHLVKHDQPIVVCIVDTAENIARLTPMIERMMNTGILAESDVQVVRVQKLAAQPES